MPSGCEAVGLSYGTAIPAVLLARLALDRSPHGHGYGSVLLAGAWQRVVGASENVAVKFVVVDAIDDGAATFYERLGFRRVPNDHHRLIRKMSGVVAEFDQQ
jgi:GNAT superfamily N-acetyltransferase